MTTTNPLIAEIERALQAGQPKAAEASALALLASEPDHLDELRLLATALHRQNRPAQRASQPEREC